MSKTPLRYKLAEIGVGAKITIVGKYVGKLVFDDFGCRLLLTDIYNAENFEYLCDHMWFYVNSQMRQALVSNLLDGFLVIIEGMISLYKYDSIIIHNYCIKPILIKGFVVPCIFENTFYFGFYTDMTATPDTHDIEVEFKSCSELNSADLRVLRSQFYNCFIFNCVHFYRLLTEDVLGKYLLKSDETVSYIRFSNLRNKMTLYLYKDIAFLLRDLRDGCPIKI